MKFKTGQKEKLSLMNTEKNFWRGQKKISKIILVNCLKI